MFIQAVNVPVHRQLVQIGVRQYMHRMVVCMEREILPFVPVVLENLLKQPDARELHDFIPLMNQLIMKFKVRQGELLSVTNNIFFSILKPLLHDVMNFPHIIIYIFRLRWPLLLL